MQKPSIPKGTRDFSPSEIRRRNFIFDIVKLKFEKFGFSPIETPSMEKLSTLTGKYGSEGDQLLFKVLKRGAKFEKVLAESNIKNIKDHDFSDEALRYDLTVPFARYIVQHQNDIVFPFKRYQIQPVWRADRPQKGRYREFYQCDADIVGSESLLNEVDLVAIYVTAFNQLQLSIEIKNKISNVIIWPINAQKSPPPNPNVNPRKYPGKSIESNQFGNNIPLPLIISKIEYFILYLFS